MTTLSATHDRIGPDGRVDPSDWWHRICWVTPQLALSGDLGDDLVSMRRRLREWVDSGITHIVDVRLEADDSRFVAGRAPHIRYHWLGVDDDDGRQTRAWFEAGAEVITSAVADPSTRVMVHCHLGVNRGPSLLFAAMLALGHDSVEAIAAIRRARPIAAVMYADDAVQWWARRVGAPPRVCLDVRRWQRAHPVDTAWIVHRLRVS